MVEKYEKLIYDGRLYLGTPGDGIPRVEHFRLHGKHFEELGYTLTKAGNIRILRRSRHRKTGSEDPRSSEELDSLIVANHPCCDPETHYVHACGHHAQCAVLLGTAAALKEPGALDGLCGSIRFISVPAEGADRARIP